jgi:hypothetical protein
MIIFLSLSLWENVTRAIGNPKRSFSVRRTRLCSSGKLSPTDLMVVFFDLAPQRFTPQFACTRDRARPNNRQRPLAHVTIATEKIFAPVDVVPMLGDRE